MRAREMETYSFCIECQELVTGLKKSENYLAPVEIPQDGRLFPQVHIKWVTIRRVRINETYDRIFTLHTKIDQPTSEEGMSKDQDKSSSFSEIPNKPPKRTKVPILVKFVIGGLAGSTGQMVTHPMDVMKIQMHMTNASLGTSMRETLRNTGFRGFYVGLTAALLRQVTYSTTRLGIYSTMLEIFRERFDRLNYPALVSLGMVSGILGSLVGTPADLVMVRMITDAKNPPDKRRCYKNAISGLSMIIRDEGVARMWRGAVPTMGRAAIVNGAQLGTYSRTKMHLKDTSVFLQFCASMISSVVTCTASMPVDMAKTEIQCWHSPAKPPGMVKTLMNIARNDGFFSLWRGLVPYYLRAGPNTVITMITMDQLAILYTSVFSSINN